MSLNAWRPAWPPSMRNLRPCLGALKADPGQSDTSAACWSSKPTGAMQRTWPRASRGPRPRSLQRFLTESPWDDGPVIDRLQQYAGRRLNQPDGVWVFDDPALASRARNRWAWPGSIRALWARWATAPWACFWPTSRPKATPWWTRRCICRRHPTVPPTLPGRRGAGGDQLSEQGGVGTGLLLRRARQAGHLTAAWVTGDSGYGEVPTSHDALAAEGWRYVLEVPSNTHVFTQAAQVGECPPWSGHGRKPTQPHLVAGEPSAHRVPAVVASLPTAEWHELTVAEGAQGASINLRPCGSGKVVTACRGAPAGCSCGAIWMAARPSTTCRMPLPTRPCCGWRRSGRCAGQSRPSSRPRRARPVSMSTKCARGWAGITISPWPYWPEPSC